MKPKEVRQLLKNFEIEYSGTGNKIVSMSPEPGTKIPIGSTIRLMLEKE